MRGFPDRGGSSPWPYETSRKASGRLDRIREDGVLEISMQHRPGVPRRTDVHGQRRLVGMVGETADGVCWIIPVDELLGLGT